MPLHDTITHAGAVVFRDVPRGLEYLVVTSSRGEEWVLPKGHVEHGEMPESAAKRELREEAGIIAEIVVPLGTMAYDKPDENVRAAFFLMRYIGVTEPAEHRRIRWLPFEEAQRLLSFDDAKELLQKAEHYLSEATR